MLTTHWLVDQKIFYSHDKHFPFRLWSICTMYKSSGRKVNESFKWHSNKSFILIGKTVWWHSTFISVFINSVQYENVTHGTFLVSWGITCNYKFLWWNVLVYINEHHWCVHGSELRMILYGPPFFISTHSYSDSVIALVAYYHKTVRSIVAKTNCKYLVWYLQHLKVCIVRKHQLHVVFVHCISHNSGWKYIVFVSVFLCNFQPRKINLAYRMEFQLKYQRFSYI